MSALADESRKKSTTFEALGREWTVPTKRNASHILWMESELKTGAVIDYNLMTCRAFLDPAVSKANQAKPDQFAALLDLEPDDDDIETLTDALADALGMKNAGNS